MTVGTGPPDEMQEILTLSPSDMAMVAFVPAKILGNAKCFE